MKGVEAPAAPKALSRRHALCKKRARLRRELAEVDASLEANAIAVLREEGGIDEALRVAEQKAAPPIKVRTGPVEIIDELLTCQAQVQAADAARLAKAGEEALMIVESPSAVFRAEYDHAGPRSRRGKAWIVFRPTCVDLDAAADDGLSGESL